MIPYRKPLGHQEFSYSYTLHGVLSTSLSKYSGSFLQDAIRFAYRFIFSCVSEFMKSLRRLIGSSEKTLDSAIQTTALVKKRDGNNGSSDLSELEA